MVEIRGKFAKDVINQVELFVEDGIEDYEENVRNLMQDVYESIVDASPIWTGYYASNHGIVIRGSKGQFKTQGFKLSPAVKASNEKFIYQSNIGPRADSELDKLNVFEAGDTVTVINDVPYAGEIEREGTQTSAGNIYANAAAQFGLDYDSD